VYKKPGPGDYFLIEKEQDDKAGVSIGKSRRYPK